MRSKDFIKMGLKNLTRRKLRTSLTILGVVIGTFSIVVMMSLGIAMTEGFEEQIMQMGSLTTITVNKYYQAETGNSEAWTPAQEKELDDNLVTKLKAIPHVEAVTPIQYMSVKLISGKYESWSTICGIEPEAFSYFDFPSLRKADI